MIELTTTELILIGTNVVVLVWLVWLQLQAKALHHMMYRMSQAQEPVTPPAELVKQWVRAAKQYPPDSPKGRAYRDRLKSVGVEVGD